MSTITRFRHLLYNTYLTANGGWIETEQEFVGDASLTPEYDGAYDFKGTATDAHILNAYEKMADGTYREIFQASESKEFWAALEVAAVDCFNSPYPGSWPIELPTDLVIGGPAPGEYQTWIKVDGQDRKVNVEVQPAEMDARVWDAKTGDEITDSVPGESRKAMWQEAYDEHIADLYEIEYD